MFKTELFNKISPEYPNINEEIIISHFKEITEFLIDHPLNREELEDFKKLMKINEVLENIYYSDKVDLDTINRINNIINTYNESIGKENSIIQTILRPFTREEIKDGIEVTNEEKFNIKAENLYTLKDINDFKKTKKEILKYINELGLNELETITFLYAYLRDNYKIEDNTNMSFYEASNKKSGSNRNINEIFLDYLLDIGINVNLIKDDNSYKIVFNQDENKYSLDIETDINILNIVGTENTYEGLMPELNKELKEKLIMYINKKILDKKREEDIQISVKPEEIQEKTAQEEKNIEYISDNTMTFAIPVSEIQRRLANDEEPELGVMLVSKFLSTNNITDEETFKEFLIKNGLSEKIYKIIPNANNFYNIIKQKEQSNMLTKKYSNRISFYVPTTENDNHSLKIIVNKNGALEIINTEDSNYMESGIRYGTVSINNYKEEQTGILVEEKLNRVRPVENITPEMIMPVYIVDALKVEKIIIDDRTTELSNESQSLICTKENNELVASDINEADKMYQIKDLGFKEEYYTKRQIAGLNKYSDGREYYSEAEELSTSNDGGITSSNEKTLVRTSGKANILLIMGLIGFVLGLGVGLAILILKIK